MAASEITLLIHVILIVSLSYLAYIDFRSFRLPDLITVPIIAIGIGFNSFSSLRFTSPLSAILGACIGYLLLWIVGFIYRLIKNQDGIGMGDAKLLAGLGAWLGWGSLPSILLLASITGLIGGMIWLKWKKQDRQQAFPFGPFLAIAGIIALLWPQLLYLALPIRLI